MGDGEGVPLWVPELVLELVLESVAELQIVCMGSSWATAQNPEPSPTTRPHTRVPFIMYHPRAPQSLPWSEHSDSMRVLSSAAKNTGSAGGVG